MQNKQEITKVNRFLSMVSSLVIAQVKVLLQSAGMEVVEKRQGPDLIFSVKAGEKHVDFHLHNLLLEIATVDRDEVPVRFDEKLRDFDFFLNKTARLIHSKLDILFHLLAEDDIDKAVENIAQDADQYQRIRIWAFDHNKPTHSPH